MSDQTPAISRAPRYGRPAVAVVLVLLLAAGVVVLTRASETINRTNVVAYFDNTNGIYVGDDVMIRGVPVGRIAAIEPQPDRVKVSFWYDSTYKVPAEVNAAILSPMLVTSRAIQLTPVYTEGPVLADHAVIPRERTVVPVEYDDFRAQLERLTETLQPDQPGGVSTLGAFVNTAADNLRGQGADIRETLIKLAQAFSALGDHSTDIFSTVKNLSILVSALQDSTNLMRQLNQNLASVSYLVADNPDDVGAAVRDLAAAVGEVQSFVTMQDYKGAYLNFNLNLNLPPACSTGFIPATQQRVASLEDYPDRPPGDVYCRVPQDSIFNVRGARNLPCITVPGKRAPTAKMCESGEHYVPLNDGFNWKGDPNATTSGQAVPQLPPGTPPAQAPPTAPPPAAPIAVAEYDPATGTYVGPDGRLYSQGDLARKADQEQTWETMLLPPTGG